MNKESLLKECIIRNSPIKVCNIDINEKTNLIEELSYSSLSFIQLIVDLENTFGYEFNDDVLKIENFNYCFLYEQLCC